MAVTTDPTDRELGRGVDETPVQQHEKYLVLSEEERAKGFVRPVRREYRHVGIPGPTYLLHDLTPEQEKLFGGNGYVKFEQYPEGSSATGRYWTQAQLDAVGSGCGTTTRMPEACAETYARQPGFYGSTYCLRCQMHRPVGKDGEFVWDDGTRVGT